MIFRMQRQLVFVNGTCRLCICARIYAYVFQSTVLNSKPLLIKFHIVLKCNILIGNLRIVHIY